jgi:hypothetical protein
VVDDKVRCAGYCGQDATTVVEWFASTLHRDAEGHLVYEAIEPPTRIPVCTDCATKAVAGDLYFTYCAADGHWGRTAQACRGGCGRRLAGWILETPSQAAAAGN